jgi:hypothetical protein
MAGQRTATQTFAGETWSDDGKTYAFVHDGVRVRVRFLDDGKIQIAILGAPPLEMAPAPRTILGTRTDNTWAKVVLQPVS